jgi:DnaK suppressor protein
MLQRQEIKQIIMEQLQHINKEIVLLKEKTQPIAPDCSLGRLTRLEAMGEQQIHEHALHEAKIRLNKLNYVLRKVEHEDFGICSECEEEIPFARLQLIPESTICVACAKVLNH